MELQAEDLTDLHESLVAKENNIETLHQEVSSLQVCSLLPNYLHVYQHSLTLKSQFAGQA